MPAHPILPRPPVLVLALALCLTGSAQPALHRLRLHTNPSLTILSMAQGPDGLLWLAATDGLYRFDGFHYYKITAFPFPTARFLGFTADGSLWCGDFEGLCHVVRNRFQIALREEIDGMATYPDQVFARFTRQMVSINLDGKIRPVPYLSRRDLTIDSLGRLWFICFEAKKICWVDPNHADSAHFVDFDAAFNQYQVAPDGKGQVWSADDEQAVPAQNARTDLKLQRLRTRSGNRPGPLLPGNNGQLWFLGETVHGLSPEIEFKDGKDNDRFSPLSGVEDTRGHLWVASLGQGLTEWIPDPSWRRWYPENFNGEAAAQVIRDRQGNAILGTDKNLYRLDARSGKWIRLTHDEHRYYYLYPLDDGSMLASLRDLGLVRLNPDGAIVEHLADPAHPQPEPRQILRDGKGRIWVAAKRALLRLDGQPGSFQVHEQPLPGISAADPVQAVALATDAAGHISVGYTNGVAWLDDAGQWHLLDTDRPADWVRSMAISGGDIWLAHRHPGFYSLLRRHAGAWHVTPFFANAGYNPVDTNFIARDSRGWIWRGSNDGVHVSDGRHLAPNDWLHLDPSAGLTVNETGQYGFFEDRDGSVWIAGDEGVTHLRPDLSWFDAPRNAAPPRITRVEADGRVFLFPENPPAKLPSATRVLKIDLGTLGASPFRNAPLRYRLLPVSKDWHLTRDASLEFRYLPENAYTLEVGYVGDGPSPVGTWEFQIGSSGTLLTWGWLLGLAAAGGAIFPAVRHVPWFARTRFRIEKALFVMRRRHRYRTQQPRPADSSDYSGQLLRGRYRLGRLVSRGGFSAVYEAEDVNDPATRLAVKVLIRTRGQESWVRDRFAHEVAALRSIDHPCVVRILDSWITPAGEPCLAMPFLEGETLRAAMVGGALTRNRAARITRQLGAALAEVHAHGIIHRDLKPENLILVHPGSAAEQPVIIDFGTAGLRTAEHELAATTLMSGSFHYMAPERLTGHYSPATDTFSLAVIVLEMLTGKRLTDLHTMFFDPPFQQELQKVLGDERLSALLAPAYDPEPRRRPQDVGRWSQEIADAILQT